MSLSWRVSVGTGSLEMQRSESHEVPCCRKNSYEFSKNWMRKLTDLVTPGAGTRHN